MAIDDAIHDGVDVLSLSIGGVEGSIGALHAVQKGITVVYSAGNDGPRPQTVENTAPWVSTVAASKTDRSFPTVITLGNKRQITSLYYKEKNSSRTTFRNLTLGGLCTRDALNGTDYKGNIVVCKTPSSPMELGTTEVYNSALLNVYNGGGSGLIFVQYTTDNLRVTDLKGIIPCVLVDIDTGKQIEKYIAASVSSPMAKIEPTRNVTSQEILCPKVAAFSSRGPSTEYAEILKPDIAAPGANILAAEVDFYGIMSGTTMAAPHVSGIVALLKAVHPKWSPAALKSAIITTASVTDMHGMPILAEGLPRKIADPFEFGGGHIDPTRAADPGLIYDIDPRDYNYFFGCTITRKSAMCNETSVPGYHLNLPSVSVPDLRHPITVSRTVTNVGEVDAVYHAAIQSPVGVKMEVNLSVLVFNTQRELSRLR